MSDRDVLMDLDRIDARVFSGDWLEDEAERNVFRSHLDRWTRELDGFEKTDDAEESAKEDPMAPGDGYRIVGDDERLLETDERKYSHYDLEYSHYDLADWRPVTSMDSWHRYGTVSQLRNAFPTWNNVVIRRKVDVNDESPEPFTPEELTASYRAIPAADLPPVESTEDWVEIHDPTHIRRRCDWVAGRTDNPDEWQQCDLSIGKRQSTYPDSKLRCRRKDLPVMQSNTVTDHVTLKLWLCWDHKGQKQGRWHVGQPKGWLHAVDTGITMEVPVNGGAK